MLLVHEGWTNFLAEILILKILKIKYFFKDFLNSFKNVHPCVLIWQLERIKINSTQAI